MVYPVFYSGDTVPQGILCVLSDLPLDDGSAEGRGKADHGEKQGAEYGDAAGRQIRFSWTNEKGYIKIKKK